MSHAFLKGALQRWAPKRPHKPSSQRLGARRLGIAPLRHRSFRLRCTDPWPSADELGPAYSVSIEHGEGCRHRGVSLADLDRLERVGVLAARADPISLADVALAPDDDRIARYVDSLEGLPSVSFELTFPPRRTLGAPPPDVHEPPTEDPGV